MSLESVESQIEFLRIYIELHPEYSRELEMLEELRKSLIREQKINDLLK